MSAHAFCLSIARSAATASAPRPGSRRATAAACGARPAGATPAPADAATGGPGSAPARPAGVESASPPATAARSGSAASPGGATDAAAGGGGGPDASAAAEDRDASGVRRRRRRPDRPPAAPDSPRSRAAACAGVCDCRAIISSQSKPHRHASSASGSAATARRGFRQRPGGFGFDPLPRRAAAVPGASPGGPGGRSEARLTPGTDAATRRAAAVCRRGFAIIPAVSQ
jgi:hypothetical protein